MRESSVGAGLAINGGGGRAAEAVLQDGSERRKIRAAHSRRRKGLFFTMDFGGCSRAGPDRAGQKRDGYFSRWPSLLSQHGSVGGPVLQWLKSCYTPRTAATRAHFHGQATAETTTITTTMTTTVTV